ncbi:hypothetical protein Bca101_029462 [Brassica carinata]
MEWAMSALLNHPDKLEKLREETRSNVKHKGVHSCFLTAHRFRFNLGNYEIPENTTLFANAWAVHRDDELWEDAEVFKPEIFEGFLGDRDGYRFFLFGVGRRACHGAGFGMRTVALAVGALVQCFEWEKVDKGDIDMTPAFSMEMAKAEPLVALPKPWPDMVPILSQL